MRTRLLFVVLIAFVLAVCVLPGTVGAVQKVERLTYSGSNPGGTWYTMTGGLIKLLNEKLPATIRVDMLASGGSVLNTRRLGTGEADLTMSYSSHLWECWNGKGIMEGRPVKIRGLCSKSTKAIIIL